MTSRKVALTAAFLALAAGGTAACDTTYDDPTYASDSDGYDVGSESDADDWVEDEEEEEEEQPAHEVFYCADEDGEIVDEDKCADADETSSYFLYHSSTYARGLKPGTYLDGGDSFSAGDRAARRAFKLPPTGKVGNGTVKTNVVGRGSTGSDLAGGTSGG
jgi:hypothetical protein